MKRYEIKYQRESSTGIIQSVIMASSASQARQILKSRNNGRITIISCVER